MQRCLGSQLLSLLKLCCTMWLLVFICMLTAVGGVPTHPTQEPTSNITDNVMSMPDVPKPATTAALQVGVIPLNTTQNVTSPAAGTVTSMLEPQLASAETLEELQEDIIIQEGDILMPEYRNAVKTLWPDAIMPYTISNELAHRRLNILSAFKMISDFTCIRFRPHTEEFNYLKFRDGKGCASFVGCQGGAQSLYYGSSCSVGNLCHEIVHALGLHHEHTRKDRDQYISVQWESVMPGKEGSFKVKDGNTLNLPYDLNSITHYGKYFFSENGSPTVLPKQSGTDMGQRTRLSDLDIERLNILYHCGNNFLNTLMQSHLRTLFSVR
ncbi:zinc metalloproteinase nas-4-like isoform X2 [Anoplopoma fimbria]|uniref:zinc metalloproteinase nas-4-like isoform X2 n=1 Tax=Anoplopoma fimbria TaxID=229290 RepID=UPI0023EB29C6|nr:zinc metalloproteinase nas-4-like isoform X2 [Anoplopoma fimbria]